MVQLCISQKLNVSRDTCLKVKAMAGANLFKQFTVKFLTQQVRAMEDEQHVKFIASFANKEYPITADVLTHFQQYTHELIIKDPAFKFAPVACGTNVSTHFYIRVNYFSI